MLIVFVGWSLMTLMNLREKLREVEKHRDDVIQNALTSADRAYKAERVAYEAVKRYPSDGVLRDLYTETFAFDVRASDRVHE